MFGRYRVEALLGRGAFGTVYLAEHINLKVFRAVKCIRKCQDIYGTAHREADVLKDLRHPAIPIIYDIEEDEECVYIVEEYVRGQSLKELISRKRLTNIKEVKKISLCLCEVMEYLHCKGIYHLDIKPDNIIVNDGNVRLLDYGNSATDESLENIRMGTKGYAPPEMYGRERISSASDIYSIGVLMLEMITGKKDKEAVKEVHPPKLKKIIQKCMCHAGRERFFSFKQIKNALNKLNERDLGRSVSLNIHIGGVEKHCGVTYCAFAIAGLYERKGRKIIVCERNTSEDMKEIAKAGDFRLDRGIFSFDGINVFPNYYGYVKEPCFSEYDIVIKDYGTIYSENMEEFLSGDIILIVSGCEPYEIKRLTNFLRLSQIPCKDSGDKFRVLINFADSRRYKKVIRLCDIPSPVRVPYGVGNNRKKDWLTLQ